MQASSYVIESLKKLKIFHPYRVVGMTVMALGEVTSDINSIHRSLALALGDTYKTLGSFMYSRHDALRLPKRKKGYISLFYSIFYK
jgi:hypothetical protein